MYISQRIILFVCLVLGARHYASALETSDFYEFDRSTVRLENGDNKFEIIKLDTPINFFSDTFDHIYVSIPSECTLPCQSVARIVDQL